MKKSNRFLMLIILAALTFSVRAQVTLGVKVGANLSNIHQDYKDSDAEDVTKIRPGFHFGLTADVPFSDNFSFQPGLLFSTKGCNYDINYTEDEVPSKGVAELVTIEGDASTALNYLEIPLHFAYKANDFQVFAGPYVALGLSGKYKYDYTMSSVFGSLNVNDEIKLKPAFGEVNWDDLAEDEDAFSALDYGLNFGVGYTVGPVLIQAGYSLGLGNISPKYEGWSDTDRSDYKDLNRVISLSVSYFFGD
ncbi:MAG: porin family protein [Lentimicrobium sp.]|nr:porin family protein [Lentimicrobium sp.]